jgi:hypothetical protein
MDSHISRHVLPTLTTSLLYKAEWLTALCLTSLVQDVAVRA